MQQKQISAPSLAPNSVSEPSKIGRSRCLCWSQLSTRQEVPPSAAQPAPPNTQSRAVVDVPCFQFEAKGSCSFGSSCKYQHRKKVEKPVMRPSQPIGAIMAGPVQVSAPAAASATELAQVSSRFAYNLGAVLGLTPQQTQALVSSPKQVANSGSSQVCPNFCSSCPVYLMLYGRRLLCLRLSLQALSLAVQLIFLASSSTRRVLAPSARHANINTGRESKSLWVLRANLSRLLSPLRLMSRSLALRPNLSLLPSQHMHR